MKTHHRTLTQRIVLVLLAAAKGFGKDVEKAGEKIQDGTD
jgi:predicted small secreted protein